MHLEKHFPHHNVPCFRLAISNNCWSVRPVRNFRVAYAVYKLEHKTGIIWKSTAIAQWTPICVNVANSSRRCRWTELSIGALTRLLLRRPIHSNVRKISIRRQRCSLLSHPDCQFLNGCKLNRPIASPHSSFIPLMYGSLCTTSATSRNFNSAILRCKIYFYHSATWTLKINSRFENASTLGLKAVNHAF